MGFIDKFKEKKARYDNFAEAHRQKKLGSLKKKEKVLQSKLAVKTQRDKNQRLRGKLSGGGGGFLSMQPSGALGNSGGLFGSPSKPEPVKRAKRRKKAKGKKKGKARRRTRKKTPPKKPPESNQGFTFGTTSGQTRFG